MTKKRQCGGKAKEDSAEESRFDSSVARSEHFYRRNPADRSRQAAAAYMKMPQKYHFAITCTYGLALK
jgi:hypothetical protein